MRAAIFVDGSFFLKRIRNICDLLSPTETASILMRGCLSLLLKQYKKNQPKDLYRFKEKGERIPLRH